MRFTLRGGSVVEMLPEGSRVTLSCGAVVEGRPHDTSSYRATARELGYADDALAMRQDHDPLHCRRSNSTDCIRHRRRRAPIRARTSITGTYLPMAPKAAIVSARRRPPCARPPQLIFPLRMPLRDGLTKTARAIRPISSEAPSCSPTGKTGP